MARLAKIPFLPGLGYDITSRYIGSRKPASPWLSPRRVPRVAASMPIARTPYWMKHSVASQTRLPGESSGRRATHNACDTGARKHDPATALCCNCYYYYYHWPSCDAACLDNACSGSIHRARINYYKQPTLTVRISAQRSGPDALLQSTLVAVHSVQPRLASRTNVC